MTNFAVIPGLGGVGPMELIILLSIVLLLFGAKKIPELAKGLGTGVREFKRGTSGAADKDEVKDSEGDRALPQGEDDRNAKARMEDARTTAQEHRS